jgi:hypothetical protein
MHSTPIQTLAKPWLTVEDEMIRTIAVVVGLGKSIRQSGGHPEPRVRSCDCRCVSGTVPAGNLWRKGSRSDAYAIYC